MSLVLTQRGGEVLGHSRRHRAEFAGGGRVGGGLVGGEGRHFQTGGQLCYHQVTLGCGVEPGEELVRSRCLARCWGCFDPGGQRGDAAADPAPGVE